jgi:hypothetical protein
MEIQSAVLEGQTEEGRAASPEVRRKQKESRREGDTKKTEWEEYGCQNWVCAGYLRRGRRVAARSVLAGP